MALSPTDRRRLMAASHQIRAEIAVSADTLSEATVVHVRQAFEHRSLIKVRVQTDERDACDRVGQWLAEHVPCDLVKRVGRVLVLHRTQEERIESAETA